MTSPRISGAMTDEVRARWSALAKDRDDPEKGRPISELIKTNDTLKGLESQRLRTYCTSERMQPSRDLDRYGKILFSGELNMVQFDFLTRVAEHISIEDESDEAKQAAHKAAAQELYDLRWGPTKVPIYNLLGLLSMILPSRRTEYLEIARFLIQTAKVPVDGTDLSGTTALSQAFSTKPGLDFEYAQMLYDAGGEVNNRNRYGCTVGQEIVQVYLPKDHKAVEDALTAFRWFMTHGGSVYIEDTDGYTVRQLVDRGRFKGFQPIMEKEYKRRAARGDQCCNLCGREDVKLLLCSRCKKVRYCQPGPGRKCQKTDWPRHKKVCKA
ncbi:hypothetical protein Hypma_006177 [Hypsizygus marmoreus]|uniref:MYND-type domain-containing protein n=1 Tax=Hypsizygus marmoreus TaxID=39966 RepID=A0A369JVK3_HYPMA|nr:hypothetical protein Hypma_006177 [Hypsizygus marmoreus]